MAAARRTSRKGTAKRSTARRSTAKKSGAKRTSARARSSRARGTSRARTGSTTTTGLDKSIERFRGSLERSLTLSRDRLQEVMDDAVKRGRMQRRDANKVVSDLVSRGRRQTDSLLRDLERVVSQTRKEVGGRAGPARRQASTAARRARRQAESASRRAGRAARDAADRPLAQADRLRRRTGVVGGFPISAYDQLTANQVRSRLSDLTPAELRKIRDYEKRNANRKGVVTAIEKKLS